MPRQCSATYRAAILQKQNAIDAYTSRAVEQPSKIAAQTHTIASLLQNTRW